MRLWPADLAACFNPVMRQAFNESCRYAVNAIHYHARPLIKKQPDLRTPRPDLDSPTNAYDLIVSHDAVGAAAVVAQPLTIALRKLKLWLPLPWLRVDLQKVGGLERLGRHHALVFISG
jgi:hypothetical protein